MAKKAESAEVKKEIKPLANVNLGREDLNALAEKIQEIISYLND